MLTPRVSTPEPGSGHARELALRVPSDLVLIDDAVALVLRHLEEQYPDLHSLRFNVRVALCEALTNAILYGNRADRSKMVDLTARYGPAAVEIHVTDEGSGFDHDAVPDPTLPENIQRPDGRGVFLIRRLMDEVRFNAKGNSVCMKLRRSQPGSTA